MSMFRAVGGASQTLKLKNIGGYGFSQYDVNKDENYTVKLKKSDFPTGIALVKLDIAPTESQSGQYLVSGALKINNATILNKFVSRGDYGGGESHMYLISDISDSTTISYLSGQYKSGTTYKYYAYGSVYALV